VVRLPRDPRRAREELDAEWDLTEEVLTAALRALAAGDDAVAWVERAVVIGRSATRSLGQGGAPGVLTVSLLSSAGATRRARGA
jgi:hypothetical protein